MKKLRTTLSTLLLAALVVAGVSYAQAEWLGPTGTPPENNTLAPINVGGASQTKTGSLTVNGQVIATTNLFANILSTNDLLTQKLTLTGNNAGVGRVLVSDENGVASWQEAEAIDGLPICGDNQTIKYDAISSAWECADVSSPSAGVLGGYCVYNGNLSNNTTPLYPAMSCSQGTIIACASGWTQRYIQATEIQSRNSSGQNSARVSVCVKN